MYGSIRDRLLAKLSVDLDGPLGPDDAPCWIWTGAIRKRPTRYGHIAEGGHRGKSLYAHRVAYELWFGPISPALDIDHLCRNPACCNPAHLEAVTRSVNLRRGKHGGGRKAGYRHTPETIEKLRAAARRRWQAGDLLLALRDQAKARAAT